MSLVDLSHEMFMEFILPHIGIKEVGNLTVVCKSLKELCDNNEIWKSFYLDTIKAEVLDTSLHFGSAYCRIKGPSSPPWNNISEYRQMDPLSNTFSFELNSDHYIQYSPFTKCIPTDLKNSLLGWGEVRTDGKTDNNFETNTRVYWKRDVSEYNQYIISEWKKYNKENGLSVVNLCQCAKHYEFKTLGIPNKCRNYKSFKKVVLKKMLTKEKNDIKKVDRNLKSKKKNLMYSKRQTEYLRYSYLKQKKIYEDKLEADGVSESIISDYENDKNRRENLIEKLTKSIE